MKTQSLFDDDEDILEVLVSGIWQETNEDFFFNDCWLPQLQKKKENPYDKKI